VENLDGGAARPVDGAQDRLWFALYRDDRMGMLDTRSAKAQDLASADARRPTTWRSTGTARRDRFDDHRPGAAPRSGRRRVRGVLLPRTTNIRRVFVDNSTNPVTFWVGSNHGASIVKLEPLD
jgi:hypothetical protein